MIFRTKVNVSERAHDIRRSKELALAAPDVREDRVAELQKMIDQGKYKVESRKTSPTKWSTKKRSGRKPRISEMRFADARMARR